MALHGWVLLFLNLKIKLIKSGYTRLSPPAGAQVEQVGEQLRSTCATFIFEIEVYPEPKFLSSAILKSLSASLGGFCQAADRIGASEAFVRQTCQAKKYKNAKTVNSKIPPKQGNEL